jgi:hypothetical protein
MNMHRKTLLTLGAALLASTSVHAIEAK